MTFEKGHRPLRENHGEWKRYIEWLEGKFESNYLPHPENKQEYILYGEWCEKRFLKEMAARSYLAVKLNPEKRKNSKVIDFYLEGWGYCDLKTQNSPFFMSQRKYGIDNNRAISFNVKDCINYAPYLKKGIDVGIFFWVDWKVLSMPKLGSTPYRWGIYFMRFSEIQKIIDANLARSHEYENRKEECTSEWRKEHGQNSDGNASRSIGLSVDWMEPVLRSSSNPWI